MNTYRSRTLDELKREAKQLGDELESLGVCQHSDERCEIRKFPRIGMPSGFRFQCLECCKPLGRWLDRRDLPGGTHPGDVLMAKIDVKAKRGATGLGGNGNAKSRAYRKFLKSAAWKRQRERVLARDQDTCQDCGERATEAAHIRYADPIERTPDRDIKASCTACNMAEREQRVSGFKAHTTREAGW